MDSTRGSAAVAATLAAAAAPQSQRQGQGQGQSLGEVEVHFLSGAGFRLPVVAGQIAGELFADILKLKPPPPGMCLQLMHNNTPLHGGESVADLAGSSLSALFTRIPLTESARNLLGRCTLQVPEEGRIEMLEVSFALSGASAAALAELALRLQPCRLIVEYATQTVMHCFERALDEDLCALEVIRLNNIDKNTLPAISKLLGRCPALHHCYLRSIGHSSSLEPEDVKLIRANTTAVVVI